MPEMPAWWDARKTVNRRSKAQEVTRAKQTGGRRQAGSGTSYRAPHDVKTGDHLEELKFTCKGSYRIRVVDWLALRKHAFSTGREPRFVVEFPDHGIRLIIVEERIK